MEEKFPVSWDTKEKNLFAILKLFSVESHNGKNPLLLYPTTEENLLRCIPQRKKLFRCIPQRKKPLPLFPSTVKTRKTEMASRKKKFLQNDFNP
jgi:hypothetical protein